MPSKTFRQDMMEQAELNRVQQVRDWAQGRKHSKPIAIGKRVLTDAHGNELRPATDGLADRARGSRALLKMEDRMLPKELSKNYAYYGLKDNGTGSKKALGLAFTDAKKVFAPKPGYQLKEVADYAGTYYGWYGPVRPEYDLLEPWTMLDVEGYLKQAIRRRISLMLRQGFEWTSEKYPQYAEYAKKRSDQIAFVMRQTFRNFLEEILTQMCLCSNCVVIKIRDDSKEQNVSGGVKNEKNGNKNPVAGYAIIPPHTIFPFIEKGVITKWRRFYESGVKPWDDYPVDDVVHFHWDKKPGHIYGTPRTVGVRDDIFALRRLEENIELLFITHLFPLFHVKVGTEDAPVTFDENGNSEIDMIRGMIMEMPKEGVFVTDERVEVKAVGAEGKSLDFKPLIDHFKSRTYIGLGMSPMDMGEADTGNKATADNVSQNLKDAIKADLDNFAGQVKMGFLIDWFSEANFSCSVVTAVSDVNLEFHEIDVDGRIKQENHAVELFNNNAITHPELRKRIKHKKLEKGDHEETHFGLHDKGMANHEHKLAKDMASHETKQQEQLAATQIKVMKETLKTEEGKTELHGQKVAQQKELLAAQAKHMPKIEAAKAKTAKAKGAAAKKTGKAKGKTAAERSVNNKNRPGNQHGKNYDPHKARSSAETTGVFYDALLELGQRLEAEGRMDAWDTEARQLVDSLLSDRSVFSENSYTNQLRQQIERLKDAASVTADPDRLLILLEDALETFDEQREFADADNPSEGIEYQDATESGDSEPEFADTDEDAVEQSEPGSESDADEVDEETDKEE